MNKVTLVLSIIWVKRIFYLVISLFLAFYCVQFYTVSNTLLCPTKYCVHTYLKGLLFTFHISMCCCSIMLCLQSTSVWKKEEYSTLTFFSPREQMPGQVIFSRINLGKLYFVIQNQEKTISPKIVFNPTTEIKWFML